MKLISFRDWLTCKRLPSHGEAANGSLTAALFEVKQTSEYD